LPLLLLTNIEEEARSLLPELLSEASELGLLHAKPGAGLPGLDAKLPELRSETADPLRNSCRLLRALEPQASCCFGARQAHLSLSLPQAAVLLGELPGKLFRSDAELRSALGNVGLGRGTRHAKLAGLLSKLPGELGGVHAGARRKLLDVHPGLGLGLGVGCRKLLRGQTRPGG